MERAFGDVFLQAGLNINTTAFHIISFSFNSSEYANQQLSRCCRTRWIGRGGLRHSATRSPDLTTYNFCLSGYIKVLVCQDKLGGGKKTNKQTKQNKKKKMELSLPIMVGATFCGAFAKAHKKQRCRFETGRLCIASAGVTSNSKR